MKFMEYQYCDPFHNDLPLTSLQNHQQEPSINFYSMKTRKHFKSNSMCKGAGRVLSSTSVAVGKDAGQSHNFTGMTQENYIDPRYLGAGMVTSISDMSFRGLWM
jgi:hypothetical protein